MKNIVRVTLFLILALSLIPAGTARAQPPPPADLDQWPGAELPDDSSEMRVLRSQQLAAPQDAGAGRAALGLGQPGLSYRYAATFGQTQLPYQIDTQHLNRPSGLFVDAAGLVYVAEERGFRVIKFDNAGQSWLTIGRPGQPWYHADYLAYPQDVAVGGDGAIWVAFQHGVKQLDRFGVFDSNFARQQPVEPRQ